MDCCYAGANIAASVASSYISPTLTGANITDNCLTNSNHLATNVATAGNSYVEPSEMGVASL